MIDIKICHSRGFGVKALETSDSRIDVKLDVSQRK